MISNKNIMKNLGYQGFQILDELQKKPRAGWIRKEGLIVKNGWLK